MARRTAKEAAATRVALLEAALAVFAERGYAATSLEEIAARAQVTRGALYHHFDDKAELYVAALGEGWLKALKPLWVELEGEGPVLERVRRFAQAWLTAIERDALLRTVLEVSMFRSERLPELDKGLHEKQQSTQAWVQQLTSLFEQARRKGEWRADCSPRTAALAVISMLNGAATTWLMSPDSFSPAREAERLTEALFKGIGS